MTVVSRRLSVVSKQSTQINRRDAKCAEGFLYALGASVVKPISDLRLLISALCALLFALSGPAWAQQPRKIQHIGFLRSSRPPESHIEAFRRALQELGYVEGKNIHIEYRYAEGKTERLPFLVAELVRLPVDVMVVDGSGAALVAKNASTIPIVMQSGNPIEIGLVSSLRAPVGTSPG